jgi:hypothetical protein
VLAAVALASMGPAPDAKTARRRRINDAVAGVAAFLGNTPTSAVVHTSIPRVLERYREGITIERSLRRLSLPEGVYDPRVQRSIERAVLRLLDSSAS